MNRPAPAAAGRRAEPQAALRFSRAPDGRSFVSRQRVGYPFHITRPFYLDEAPRGGLTLYLQSVSGGIYQGEDLRLACVAEPGSVAHVTTQAATIVHRMPAGGARQTVRLEAAQDAFLEYLPDPLILFPGARLESVLDIAAHRDATVIACEGFAHHDPGGDDRRFDRFRAEMRIGDESGRLLALERYAVAGARLARGAGQAAPWPAQGGLVVVHRGAARAALGAALRAAVTGEGAVYGGASALPNESGVAARLLARDGAALRRALAAAWRSARLVLHGAPPADRRK